MLALLVGVALIYLHGLDNPFLSVERQGLLYSKVFTDLEVFLERFVSLKGLLHKPLSMVTFALQFEYQGTSPAFFHMFNIALHMFNVLLFWRLCCVLQLPPFFASAVYAFHPLQTSVATLIYGRPYLMGSTFMLLALLVLAQRANTRLQACDWVVLTALWLAMVLSKQVFVIFPVLAYWVFRSQKPCSQDMIRRVALSHVLVIIGSLSIACCFIWGYALPYSQTAQVDSQVFFLSQLGNFLDLIARFFVFPAWTALLHDLPWYPTVFSLKVLLGAVLLLSLVVIVVKKRWQPWAVYLGATLLLLLPTQSIFPKDQVLVEWRLTPALVFFCLFLAAAWQKVSLWELTPKWETLKRSIAGAYIGLLIVWTFQQIDAYRTVETAYQDVLQQYPHSLFALNDLGNHYGRTGHYDLALYHLHEALKVSPKHPRVLRNIRHWKARQQSS